MRVMEIKYFKLNFLLFAILSILSAFSLVLHAQDDQAGFISLDCGLPTESNYTEPTTQIKYISDAAFITRGSIHTIAAQYETNFQEQLKVLRSFPNGIRNCYRINVKKGSRYFIRGSFLYANYDGLNTAPEFDLHLGPNFWDTVSFVNISIDVIREIIHVPLQDYVRICLVNTGSGTPFISALELRPISSDAYYNDTVRSDQSLSLFARFDIGSTAGLAYRYPYDFLDRFWLSYNGYGWTQISTSQTMDPNSTKRWRPPSIVMSTAATPMNESEAMKFSVYAPDESSKFYFYLHFAELQQPKANESRAFNITINGNLWSESVVPVYLNTTTFYNPTAFSGSPRYNFSIVKLENSTLPPIFNGLEVYTTVDILQSETEEKDADAIIKIKSTYGITRNWDGDPCAPVEFLWLGLNCSYNGFDPPRIILLNLSSSGLTGEITSHISKLSLIQSLDLSKNNLTGSVPEFLSQLPNLSVLNLEKNKLTGSVPPELIKQSNNGILSLRVGENPNLCTLSNCKKKKNTSLIPIVASVGGLVGLLLIIAMVVLVSPKKKKKQESNNQKRPFESIKRQFTYSEVQRITNNFERILGKGGFGTVYHGYIDETTQVAVKLLSSSSVQGYQQFQAEVKILLKVYHRNLTNLVGYCNEGSNMALIYEYMPNGDLGSHLSGHSNANVLSWEVRLQIAMDAAQGLEYMHHGCKPPIVHRDVKTTNILLTENFQAKLADFGLSRIFPVDDVTHVSTAVGGTPGYLDPEYHITSRVNEKSDVYSYGVVLLEIITNRPAISRARSDDDERIHVSQWVSSMLDNGVITSIVDPRLQGDFSTNSAWKAVEIAMTCVSSTPTKRPNMSEVVSVLKECLGEELARKNHISRLIDSTDFN